MLSIDTAFIHVLSGFLYDFQIVINLTLADTSSLLKTKMLLFYLLMVSI